MFWPPSCQYALYRVVPVYRHVATLLMCVKYAQHSILLNHFAHWLVLSGEAAGVGKGGRAWESVQGGRDSVYMLNGASVRPPLLPAGPLAAHRLRQKQKATRTHLRYKARSRRNHETGSVGGKQTERTANSLQPNLHSPPLIQVRNLIKSSGKVSKASVLNDVWQSFMMTKRWKYPAQIIFSKFDVKQLSEVEVRWCNRSHEKGQTLTPRRQTEQTTTLA